MWSHDVYRTSRSTERLIDRPHWSDIRFSYPGSTRHALDQLIAMCTPPTTGRLLLWHARHGTPGTGKR